MSVLDQTTKLKQSERQFERAVVEYAQLNGWLVYHTFDSRRSNPGFPDLVLVRDGELIFAELKTEKARLSAAQLDWLAALAWVEQSITEGCSRPIKVTTWRPRAWPEIEKVLAR